MAFIFLLSGRIFSQVILAPDLQCIVNDNTSGNITLYWTNPPNNPCGAFVQYNVYASCNTAAGPYTLAGSVSNQNATSFIYAGALSSCATWYFYMEADYNCSGAIVQQSDTVNNLNPATPAIINVDVTPTGDVNFNWQPSSSPQTQGYVIYYYLSNGNAIVLDTVFGRFNTTYTDVIGDPTTASLVYTVAAFDSCWKYSAFNTSPHNTIFAVGSVATCDNDVSLAWNKYINWSPGVKEYQIWVSANLGAFTQVGSVDSNTLLYNYSGFNDGDSLCIFIRAVSAADSTIVSSSNVFCLRATVVQTPDYIFITNATVDLQNQISVTWIIDTAAELTFYRIDRSANNVTFNPALQYNVPTPLNIFEMVVDSDDVFPQTNAYWYTVTTFDSCNHEFTSTKVKTINLQGELYDYYVAHLTWNNFELDSATVIRYNLYRNYGSGYQLIQTFLPGVNEYSDSLQQFLNEKGVFCYRIEAVYDLNLPTANYMAQISSFSNEVCIIHRPIIYIPNAFAPEGVNNVFKPTIIYGAPKGYSMIIFNRWGGKIFESNDPAVGWDGNDHGKPATLGGYAYLIQFYADDGVLVERKGMVLLVR